MAQSLKSSRILSTPGEKRVGQFSNTEGFPLDQPRILVGRNFLPAHRLAPTLNFCVTWQKREGKSYSSHHEALLRQKIATEHFEHLYVR